MPGSLEAAEARPGRSAGTRWKLGPAQLARYAADPEVTKIRIGFQVVRWCPVGHAATPGGQPDMEEADEDATA